ncbi:alpha/beta hydrolase family protein [Paenibacillus hodogayensis]|uniref:Alpha/beta hydrolase family protein n=1 Tax=Paenibacillus hodogayensis TaxID=279208 RepID=A0ABV5VXU3_9BACL
MALIECNFWSDTLGTHSTMLVIVPNRRYVRQPGQSGDSERTLPEGKLPTLYLLHGLGDDHTSWLRRTRVEEYANAVGVAVVMPNAGRSFYANMDRGHDYWTFVGRELPYVAQSLFPLSGRREDCFVAGNSMGGYGAFKLALAYPDRFAAAASLSGVLDIAYRADPQWREFVNIFGDLNALAGSPNDLLHLADRAAASGGPVPLLYQCCGTADFLYEHNERFAAHARRLGLPLAYDEEKESHNWAYWDRQIARVIDWLPIDSASTS